jgi:hypothetical protein
MSHAVSRIYMRFLTPHMMDIVKSANLGKEGCKSLIIIASIVDSTCPVVSPFNHGSRFETIAAHLIKVRTCTWFNRWPVAECQQVLKMA